MSNALAPVREWRVHLGVHKTATTHLQQTLAERRDEILAKGVDVLPLEAVRALDLAGPRPARRRVASRLRGEGGRAERALAAVRKGPDRVVLSEENLLGPSAHALEVPSYPLLERRLDGLGMPRWRADLHLFVAVRSFDTLFPSAYAELLRHRPVPGGFAPLAERVLAQTPSWADFLRRLRAVVPRASVSAWRYEDYRANDWAVMSRLCGVRVEGADQLPPPPVTRAPSARAVVQLEGIPAGLDRTRRAAAVQEIVGADRGGEPFMPFSGEERAVLRERYEADLRSAERALPGVLMRLADHPPGDRAS